MRRLPIDMIKIDRSFVSPLGVDQRDVEIVRWVVQLARNLELEVVAEGIEEEVQRVRLVGLGCASGQGFLFSRAVPLKGIVGQMDRLTAARRTWVPDPSNAGSTLAPLPQAAA
jgi:EAL domain-containing protein (putative c-di-GMP-specific phosphodiesterase class I)